MTGNMTDYQPIVDVSHLGPLMAETKFHEIEAAWKEKRQSQLFRFSKMILGVGTAHASRSSTDEENDEEEWKVERREGREKGKKDGIGSINKIKVVMGMTLAANLVVQPAVAVATGATIAVAVAVAAAAAV